MKKLIKFLPIYIILILINIRVEAFSGSTSISELPVNTEKGQYITLYHIVDTSTLDMSIDYTYDNGYLKLVGFINSNNSKCSLTDNTITCSNVSAKNAFVYPIFKIINTFNGNKDISATFNTTEAHNTTKTTITKVDKVIEVSAVELGSYEESLLVGATYQIVATILPENANNKSVTYNATNPEIATITQTGLITAVQEGTTTITVASGNQKAIFTVNVSNEEIPLESISIQEKIELKEGESEVLKVIYTPEDTTVDIGDIVYSSSDEKIAIVDSSGKVIAIKEGTATVTASLGDQTTSSTITVAKEKAEEEKKESAFVPCVITGIVTFIVTALIFFIKSLIKRKKELDGGNNPSNDDDISLSPYI